MQRLIRRPEQPSRSENRTIIRLRERLGLHDLIMLSTSAARPSHVFKMIAAGLSRGGPKGLLGSPTIVGDLTAMLTLRTRAAMLGAHLLAASRSRAQAQNNSAGDGGSDNELLHASHPPAMGWVGTPSDRSVCPSNEAAFCARYSSNVIAPSAKR